MNEASHCVEPETLIPFKLWFCKLVMAVDQEQLPAMVTSRMGQQLDHRGGESELRSSRLKHTRFIHSEMIFEMIVAQNG